MHQLVYVDDDQHQYVDESVSFWLMTSSCTSPNVLHYRVNLLTAYSCLIIHNVIVQLVLC